MVDVDISDGKDPPCYYWENLLFLWPCSIAISNKLPEGIEFLWYPLVVSQMANPGTTRRWEGDDVAGRPANHVLRPRLDGHSIRAKWWLNGD